MGPGLGGEGDLGTLHRRPGRRGGFRPDRRRRHPRSAAAGQDITLLKLPVNPPPEHPPGHRPEPGAHHRHRRAAHQPERLVRRSRRSPLNAVLDQIQEQVVDNVVTQVEAQLASAGGERPRHHPEQAGPSRSRRDPGQRPRPPARCRRPRPSSTPRWPASRSATSCAVPAVGSPRPLPLPRSAPPALPTAVSAGYESMPGQHAPGDDSHNGFVVAALAIMAVAGTALVVVRRLYV